MTETGILDAHRKRHTISEPNCKPVREKGRPLGFEIFASLFTFYAIACIISLMLLFMENIFHPKSKFWLENDSSVIRKTDKELFDMPAQYEIPQEMEEPIISKRIKAFVKDLDSFTDDKHLKLFLWNKVKSKIS